MSELKTNLEQILQEKTTKLIPENIKRKVEIFDVTGTDGDAEVEELQAKIIETRQEIADTKRDLENSAATVTGTGENVTLNQTAEATLKKLGVGGNSEQVSYEGYNLININNQVNRTDSGVEITADAEKQTIKFNGTISNTYCTSAKLALSEPLSTGVFRANFNSKCDAFIVFRASDDTWLKSIQSSNNSAIDISTLSKPVTHIQFGIEHLTSGTNVNYEVGYQLTEGNELKLYEPYTGGIASPNPDYPQEIRNVEGKNLLKCVLPDETTKDGLTITRNSDGSFVLNGTSTANGRFNITSITGKLYFTLQELGFFEGDKGFLSGCPSGGNASTPTISYKIFMSGLSGASNINDDGSGAIINANSSNMNGKFYIAIDYALGITFNNLVFKPMIVKGITTKTEYVPYNTIGVKIQNKNLFDKNNFNEINANFNNAKLTFGYPERVIYFKCQPNTTYTFKKLVASPYSRNSIGETTELPAYGVDIQNIDGNINLSEISHTTTSTAKYIVWWYYNTSNETYTKQEILDSIQIEQNTVATDYTPHQEQAFNFPLAEGQRLMEGDYLADDGIHHVREQIVLDGNSPITSSHYGINSYVLTLPNRAISNETDLLFISSHFKGIPANQRGTAPNVIYSNTAQQAEIRNTEFSTLASFREWLEDNNPIVEYVLEQEVVVPYTEEQQQVYNEMKKAISYEGQTNVIGSSGGSNPIFTITAFRDADLAIASLDNRVTLLED